MKTPRNGRYSRIWDCLSGAALASPTELDPETLSYRLVVSVFEGTEMVGSQGGNLSGRCGGISQRGYEAKEFRVRYAGAAGRIGSL